MRNNNIETRKCSDCVNMKTYFTSTEVFDCCMYYDDKNYKDYYHKIINLSEASTCPFYEDDEWVK